MLQSHFSRFSKGVDYYNPQDDKCETEQKPPDLFEVITTLLVPMMTTTGANPLVILKTLLKTDIFLALALLDTTKEVLLS